jgi:predicted Rossmann fold nucleotide-binding protein DprA/Smf involved in DNA uptake
MQPITRTRLVLMLHSVPHLGPRGIARVLSEVSEIKTETLDPDELRFWRSSAAVLREEYKFHPEAADCLSLEKPRLMAVGAELARAVDAMKIRVITSIDADYPSALLDDDRNPPPVLYAHGNLGLLRDRKYAVLGSANVGPEGLEIIREFSGILSDEGLAAVTSHNTDAYQVAGVAAKSRNAAIAVILDRGLMSAFPRGLQWEPVPQARIWDLRFDPERDLALSAFRLYDPWIGANARERDRMVFALADVVVAVEVRAGGVMERECARANVAGREVYVYAPDKMRPEGGNSSLIGRGCTPIPGSDAASLLRTLDILHEPVGGIFEENE